MYITYRNIASRTNKAEWIYGIRAYLNININIYIYIYIYIDNFSFNPQVWSSLTLAPTTFEISSRMGAYNHEVVIFMGKVVDNSGGKVF